jgi:hypothetical protein
MAKLNRNISGTDKYVFWLVGETAGEEEVIPLAGLFSVATCDWLSDLTKVGIPGQLVHRVYEDHGQIRMPALRQNKGQKLKIVCLMPPGVNKVRQLLLLISLFNPVVGVELSICCTIEESVLLRPFANDHLLFLLQEGNYYPEAASDGYTIVITYGPGALHFMRHEIPVVIIGPYGFGGLVTEGNFTYLLKNGFCGRPGGCFREMIPSGVVQEELDVIRRMEGLESNTSNVRKLAEGLSCKPLSAIGELVEQSRLLYESLYNDKARWELRPLLATNIQIVNKQPQTLLRRAEINDTVAIVNEEDLVFFQQMNGGNNCRDLLEYSKIPEMGFWKLIYALWDKKIIVF